MPSIYDFKPTFQKILNPLVDRLADLEITANQVTISAMILSIGWGLALGCFPTARWLYILLPVVLLVRMGLNAIDGQLARNYQMQSSLGTYLNELGDVLSDAVLYLPFALVPGVFPPLPVIVTILAGWSEMAGVLGIVIGGSRHYEGPMGKSDRAFVFAVLGLMVAFGITPQLVNGLLVLTVILLLGTIGNRVSQALKEVKS